MHNPAPLRPPSCGTASAKRLRRRLRLPPRASEGGLDTVTHMALTASFSLELPSAAGLLFFLRVHALHAAQFSCVEALRALFAARASSARRNNTLLSSTHGAVVIRALYKAGENEKTVGSREDGLAQTRTDRCPYILSVISGPSFEALPLKSSCISFFLFGFLARNL